MYSFPNFEPVHCSMSGSNCCFLTCIQISQEAAMVVWYSHLFKNFPQFVVIHTVKHFWVVNETEVDVFLEFPCFCYDPMNVGSLISGSSASLKPNLYIGNSQFIYCWSLAWRILSIILLVCEMRTIARSLSILWHCSLLGMGWKLTFSNLWPLLSFPNLLTYWMHRFNSIIF